MSDEPHKIALVCDWLTEGFGGGERVIKALHDMYPDAPIYTSQHRPQRTGWLGAADVRTGWLNRLPVGLKRFIPFLRQWYFSRLDLTEYDIVISITGAEAKAVKTRPDARHISYMHAPTQYYWTLYDQYIEQPGFGLLNPLARLGLRLLVGPLRRADYRASQRPTVIVANSTYIQAEIKKYYHRDSQVVWPNVDIDTIKSATQELAPVERRGFVITGRQVSWKRMDLAIATVQKTGDQLTIIGDGPEHERLVKMAEGSSNITFLPRYDGVGEVVLYLRGAKGFIFPSLEPFGIAAVEALAAGTPLVALRAGGAIDFVQEGTNGVFFDEQTPESLQSALSQFATHSFSQDVVAVSAEKFSAAAFWERMREIVGQ